ncbi:hypothetical protein SAMN05216463_102110 [Xylanibacter ruminicola]|uniref:Uncharacterized protein n=1 Tax=Xylanibacter ruminicola TaxID=839 RepID=A0A1M6RTZ4_XYLRU|nr:hypothetical protein SAMN05216463_102110 [Xylanibacter ruminicola]
MKKEVIIEQEELDEELLDCVAGGGKAGAAGKTGKVSKKVIK